MRIRNLIEHPRYSVSDTGRVWNNNTGNELTAKISNSGYWQVSVTNGKKVYIHRLVAQAFLDRRGDDLVVDHINSDKLDNHYDNLQWVTSSYNNRKAFEVGEKVAPVGSKSSASKLTEAKVSHIRELYSIG